MTSSGSSPVSGRSSRHPTGTIAALEGPSAYRVAISGSERIERVVLESTSDYWRGFFYLFEARGLVVWLVNAKQVKNVPGRPKTDPLTELLGVPLQLSA